MTVPTIDKHITRRILVAVFCIFIATVVSIVMFRIYTPEQNSLAALSSVCMDVICIIILLILIVSISFDGYGLNRTTRLFAILLLASIWALFLDFLNWAFDGSLQFGHMTFWFTAGSLCMGAILACIFTLYMYRYMYDTHNLRNMKKSAWICAGANIVSFLVTVVLALSGTAFEFVDGHYETGALYDVVTVIPILTLLYMTGFIIRNAKEVGTHDVMAVAGYILFMIAGALIEAVYGIGTTYVAVSMADIFIFVMLQNQIIAQEKRNVQKWMKKSNTDVLTSLPNRYAYETDITALEASGMTEDFVYLSVDVNSLKLVNDSLGHYAGDELLLGAADCLKKCFSKYGKIYRMGGDEFIGLLHADEAQLNKLKSDIEDITQRWSGNMVKSLTLSCGYVSKSEVGDMPLSQIAVMADHRMYEAKDEYYKRTGIERRRKKDYTVQE